MVSAVMSSSAVDRVEIVRTTYFERNVNTELQDRTHVATHAQTRSNAHANAHTQTHSTHITHTHHKHTPYLVCLGGGVEGSSVEWGPLLALVPFLKGNIHHRRGGEGWKGEDR